MATIQSKALRLRLRVPPLDWPLAWAAIGLTVMGLLTVYSATSIPGVHEGLWLKQLMWAGMPVPQLLLGLSPILNVALFVFTGSVWWFAGVLVAVLAWFRPRLPALAAVLLLNGVVAVATPHIWNGLHDYQKRRIETFLN